MKETCYISANEIIGPCGPCSFINMLDLKGSAKLEKELAELGRLKPFYPSDFTSFLAWAEKYKIKLKIFVSTKEIPDKTFEMMFKYEKIPKEEQQKKKKECLERRNKILKKKQIRGQSSKRNSLSQNK